jgi:hypothetical protein
MAFLFLVIMMFVIFEIAEIMLTFRYGISRQNHYF